MNFIIEERPSDSPFVDLIWRTHSEGAGSFISLAESHWGMVITRQSGKTTLTVRGPETRAMPAPVPGDAEFFGINFKLGAYMPVLPSRYLVDQELNLPGAPSRSFWLNGSAWQIPTYENADSFVSRLARQGLLVSEPVVEATLQGRLKEASLRSVQRYFLRSTGLTHNVVRQIERARHAMALLQRGVSILDTVYLAGYFDQPHMTRGMKHLIGQTPAQIFRLS